MSPVSLRLRHVVITALTLLAVRRLPTAQASITCDSEALPRVLALILLGVLLGEQL